MTVPDRFEYDALAACVRRHLPDAGPEIEFARIPTGKFNTGHFVRVGDQQYVLRIAPPRDSAFVFYERGMMRQEPRIHRIVREKTSVPVAEVIAFDDSHELIGRDFILMRRLPGRPLCDIPGVNYDRVMHQVGRCLGEVHRLTAEQCGFPRPLYGYLGEHHPMEPEHSWPAAFRVMWRKLIDDVAATGHYDQADCRALADLLDRHAHAFDRPVPAALLHMDVWNQNILVVDTGTVTGLVDWDRALWGDPEIEFAVLDYCGISPPAFWAGYGQPRDRSREAQVRNVFYLLYEMQKYIVIRHGRNHNPDAARRHKQQVFTFVRECFGEI